jgi:hypothetical protein
LIFLAFVVPLALYFLVLAYVNRSRHPIMVSGPWDFAGVLLAVSGFVILGGPAILTGLHEQWRMSWLLGQTRFLQGLGENWLFWVGLWGFYFVAVVYGAAFLLWRRRQQTSIYNIEAAVFEEVLTQVLDRLGFEWVRGRPFRFFVRPRDEATIETYPVPEQGLPRFKSTAPVVDLMPGVYKAAIDVEVFAAMHHLTLHWLGETHEVRLEIEAELGKALTQVHSRENPASAWFMSLAILLLLAAFLGLLGLVALRVFRLLRG